MCQIPAIRKTEGKDVFPKDEGEKKIIQLTEEEPTGSIRGKNGKAAGNPPSGEHSIDLHCKPGTGKIRKGRHGTIGKDNKEKTSRRVTPADKKKHFPSRVREGPG